MPVPIPPEQFWHPWMELWGKQRPSPVPDPDPTPDPKHPITPSVHIGGKTDGMLARIDRDLAPELVLPAMCPAIKAQGEQFSVVSILCAKGGCAWEAWGGTSWCEKHLGELRGED